MRFLKLTLLVTHLAVSAFLLVERNSHRALRPIGSIDPVAKRWTSGRSKEPPQAITELTDKGKVVTTEIDRDGHVAQTARELPAQEQKNFENQINGTTAGNFTIWSTITEQPAPTPRPAISPQTLAGCARVHTRYIDPEPERPKITVIDDLAIGEEAYIVGLNSYHGGLYLNRADQADPARTNNHDTLIKKLSDMEYLVDCSNEPMVFNWDRGDQSQFFLTEPHVVGTFNAARRGNRNGKPPTVPHVH